MHSEDLMKTRRSNLIFKKVLSAFLAVAMISTTILAVMPSVYADDGSAGLRYTSNGDGTCVVSKGTCNVADIIIPEKSPSNDTVVAIGAFGESFNVDSGTTYGDDNVQDDIFGETVVTKIRLRSVVIPATVTEISAYAFESCANLTTITYDGTPSQWAAIEKGNGWNAGTGSYTINFLHDDHTHTPVTDPSVAPTCTTTGLTQGSHCSVCGEVLTAQTVIPATGHTVVVDAAVAATCTTTGLTQGTHCSVCHAVLTAQQVVPATGHTVVTDYAVAATCTESGLTQGSHCSVCGTVLTAQQVVAATGHTEVIDAAVAPTCTETGLTQGKHCSVCGVVLIAQQVVPATGHTEVIDAAVAATCTESGLTQGKHCSVCGEILIAPTPTTPLGHTWDGGVVTTAPTCTVSGVKTYTCTACGEKITEPVAALGHTWNGGVVTTAPTCTVAGIKTYTCTVCGEETTEPIAATGHTEVVDAAVAATCTTAGLTQGSHCSVCNAVLTAQQIVAAMGHSWNDGVVTTQPTTTATGVKTYTCATCGATRTESIPKLIIIWDGTVADDFAGGSGTRKSPYRIATAAQWAYFSQYVYEYEPGEDEYFVLTADLYFNEGDASEWGETPPDNDLTDYMIGSWDYPFCANFDGQGHKLSGVYMSTEGDDGTGIFGATANHETAVIRNLIVENSYIYAEGCTVGTVVGQCRAGSTTLENIYVTDTVKVVCGKYGSNNDSYAGGIVGHFSKNSATNDETLELVVTSCVNGASVTAQGRSVGGIVGNGNGNNVYATDCLNYGNISGSTYVAGIVGYNSNKNSTVDRCVNLGTITGTTKGEITLSTSSSKKPVVTDCLALSTSYGENLNSSGCDVITVDDFMIEGFLDTDKGESFADDWTELSYDITEGHVNDICVPYSLYDALSGNIPQSKFAVVQLIKNVMMLPGASVRFNEPTGIRFVARFSKDYIDGLGDELERLGVIIAPETYVTAAGEFTAEALDALSSTIGKTTYVAIDNTGDGFRFSNASTAETDGFYTFNAVLGNIRENNHEIQFSAISFVELTDGTIVYSDYDPTYNRRNISAVSRSAYDDVVILDTKSGIPGYSYFVEEVEVDNVTKYKYSPYSQSRRTLLFNFFKGDLLDVIAEIFSKTKTPTEYTVGEDRYDIDCNMFKFTGTTKAEFDAFIDNMQTRGYKLHTTNGEDGINEICYQATIYNSRYTINIAYFSSTGETFITVEAFRAVSPLQIKPQSQVYGTDTAYHNLLHPNTPKGAYSFGECDIFQLSNDHFIIVDGAQEYSSTTLIEYLEDLVGPGNTPIVDAWFFTHAHPDHIYCFWGIGNNEDLVNRIKVNGLYYTWPNDEGMRKESDYEDGILIQVGNFNSVLGNFRDENGKVTPRYKLHAGMVFYVNEIKVEILLTQDQLMPTEYTGGFNDSSTSFKFTVYSQGGEETTFLIMGDAHRGVCTKLTDKYDYDTLHTDFFTSLHHGSNDITEFFQFICPDYLIYTDKVRNKKGYSGYTWLEDNSNGWFVAGDVIPIPYSTK